MPVFDADTIRGLIADGDIAGVTLDSNAIFSFGRSGNLRHPLLTALASLSKQGLKIVLTDVVVRESERHFVKAMLDEHSSVSGALKRLSRLGGKTKEAVDAALAVLPDAATQESIVREEFAAFLKMLGAEVLSPDAYTDIASILELYFSDSPPFANPEKKAEFPDAIALATLQAWSETNGDLVVVSSDKDWKDFLARSETAHVSGDLRAVLGSFQEDDELASKFVEAFAKGEDGLVSEVRKAIQRSLDDLDFDIDFDTDWIVEVQAEQVDIVSMELDKAIGKPEITGSDASSVTLSLPISTKLRVMADASFSVTDPIDRDEVSIGSNEISADTDHDFVVVVVVSGKGEDEMEVIEAAVSPDTRLTAVDFGYVGFERYHDPDDD